MTTLGVPATTNTSPAMGNFSSVIGDAGGTDGTVPSLINTQDHLGNISQLNSGISHTNTQNALGVTQGSGSYASDTEAAIARAEYGDYKSTFQPLESYLANMVGNTGYQTQQIGQSQTDFSNQFNAAQGTNQRQLGRYGLSMTPDQQTSYNRLQDENKALGMVSTTNRTQRGLRDQDYYILSGGAMTAPTSTGAQNLVTQGVV